MSADRNLLFGILAVQMNFVGRDALILAMNAWVLDKQKPLGKILAEQGQLSTERLQLLEALVNEHLKTHNNDPQQSLAALSSADSAKRLLAGIGDIEVQATLMLVGSQSSEATAAAASPPSTRYQILRPHARGGLGEVFVAEDSELHREVALKEIQLQHADDAYSRSRFVLEAEITGGLEHPGIVPVYGLGTYGDGRPFYAMKFIRGDSLKEAIERFHNSNPSRGREGAVNAKAPVANARGSDFESLEFRQLLRRFTDVCNAIAYAHSRGVLHRDLKPGNIMLGRFGETLVVDWGLAKVVGRDSPVRSASEVIDEPTLRPPSGSGVSETVAGSALGTPAFMSPEQAAGKIAELGPATDIYSLGATLYVLLTGRAPFIDPQPGLILAQIQLGEYQRPRQVKPGIPAPLDAVCRKGMALKPADRYPSALVLAADIDHWLADEPVSCFREPMSLRARRWLRKHSGITTGVAATILVSVIGLAGGLYFVSAEKNRTEQARIAAELSEEKAKTEAATATAVKEFLKNDLLALASAGQQKEQEATGVKMDPDLKVRDLVLRAAQKIEGKFQDQPMVEAEIRSTLGWTLREIGRADLAIPQEARVLEVYTAKLGLDHPYTLTSMNSLALSYFVACRIQEALQLREKTLLLRKAKLGPDHPDTLSSMGNLATSYDAASRTQEALQLREETLQLMKAKLGPDHPDTLSSMNNLAASYAGAGRTQEAHKLYEETLQLRKAKLGPDHPNTLDSMMNLALSFAGAGRTQEESPPGGRGAALAREGWAWRPGQSLHPQSKESTLSPLSFRKLVTWLFENSSATANSVPGVSLGPGPQGGTWLGAGRHARGRSYRPRLEVLEDRLLPADLTILVTTNLDDTSNPQSLRAAITEANGNPSGFNHIEFQIATDGSVQTITLSRRLGLLPEVTGNTLVDGTTESGFDGKPRVVIDGSQLRGPGNRGLVIGGGELFSGGVRGLCINGFSGDGLVLQRPGNNAGGITVDGIFSGVDPTGQFAVHNGGSGIAIFGDNEIVGGQFTNVLSGNKGSGLVIDGAVTGLGTGSHNTVFNSFLGTDVTGTKAIPNANDGVFILNGSVANTIGDRLVTRNVISGNKGRGIEIDDSSFTTIQANYIGTDVSGTLRLRNHFEGIFLSNTHDDRITQAAGGEGNVIAGNGLDGILMDGGVTREVVESNFIGTNASGQRLGNGGNGINIFQSDGNTIAPTGPRPGNTIAFNHHDGVLVDTSTADDIQQNSIFGNAGLGIELRNGGNNNQVSPVLTSAMTTGSSITIAGRLTSAPNSSFTLEFFANLKAGHHHHGQGQTFIGSATANTNGNGKAHFAVTFTVAVPAGQFITATATDFIGDTSMFSRSLRVTSAADAAFVNGPLAVNQPRSRWNSQTDAAGLAEFFRMLTAAGFPVGDSD